MIGAGSSTWTSGDRSTASRRFLPRIRAAKAGGHVLFTSSFAGLVPNFGLGPYCVAKYGVVAMAEVLHRELRDDRHRRFGALPDARRAPTSSRPRSIAPLAMAARSRHRGCSDQDEANPDLAGRVLDVDDVAAMVVRAIDEKQLYILPHEESRASIRRRFERIDRAFER